MATVNWLTAVSGSWTNGARWSGGSVPTSLDDAVIGIAGVYTVSLTGSSQTVNSLTVSDKKATLAIVAPGKTESITTDLSNSGTVTVDATGGGGTTVSVGGAFANSGNFTLGNSGATTASTLKILGATTNSGQMILNGRATLSAKSFTNNGILGFDSAVGDTGGGSASLGNLANKGDLQIGGNALTSDVSVTVAGLNNNLAGTIHLVGTHEAQASLISKGAAPTTWKGTLALDGSNTLVQFASGGITTIAANSEIFIQSTTAEVNSGASGGNSALTGLTTNLGKFFLVEGASLTTNVGLTNSRSLFVQGGSVFNIGGTLNNTGSVNINSSYNSGYNRETLITAAGLVNTGGIFVTGSSAQSTLEIDGAAPTTLTGNWQLNGDALVEFGSGGITSIASGGNLSLDEARARMAIDSDPTSNSALTGLKTNSGSLSLNDGAALATTVGLTNGGSVNIDSNSASNYSGSGGSSFDIGGTLSNNGTFNIGNSLLLDDTQITAAGLSNPGFINLTGSTIAQASLDIAAAAPSTLTGHFNLVNDALLHYTSGAITAIGGGASLLLSGAQAEVDIGVTGDNSALTTLASIGSSGNLTLQNGASLTTTPVGGFNNGGFLSVDAGFGAFGGSKLTINAALSNITGASISIGNSGIGSAVTVTAQSLTNTGGFSLNGGPAAATLHITGNVSHGTTPGFFSSFNIDTGSAGGAVLTVDGTLTNAAFMQIGNAGLSRDTLVTVGQLVNTGNISLSGNSAGGAGQARINVGAAAPSTLTGGYTISGNAVLHYTGSTGITAIGNGSSGSGLSLNGAAAQVNRGAAVGNSALGTLGSIATAASLSLSNGADVTTTVAFVNNGMLNVDSSFLGGSSFTVSGQTLTNNGIVNIGNTAITAAATVTASSLDGTGTVNIFGGTAQARLNLGAAPAVLTGHFNLGGNAVLHYTGSAGLGSIASGSNLSLSGAGAQVNAGASTGNSALKSLTANSGSFSLNGGAAVAITGAFANNSGGFLTLDTGSGGGSSLSVGGMLTNSGFIAIGPSSLPFGQTPSATNVTAAGLTNNSGANLSIQSVAGATATLTLTGASTDAGTISVNSGGVLTLGSNKLTVTGSLSISAVTAAATVIAGSLDGTGTINITGGTAQAKLNLGAAPAVLAGHYNLSGNAVLHYTGSAGLGSIASGSSLSLSGAAAQVNAGATTGNSALKSLTANSGNLSLNGGAAVAVTGALTNNGGASLSVDNSSSTSGGSSLDVGGMLTNSGSIIVGPSFVFGPPPSATDVSAVGLTNNAGASITIQNIAGSTSTLTLTAASSDAGTISVNSGGVLALGGNTLTVTGFLNFSGGTIEDGTLAGAGSKSVSFGTGTLDGVTVAAGATVSAGFGTTLVVKNVTVNGTLNGNGGAALTFAKAGADSLTNVVGFTTMNLATGGVANTLTLADDNYTGVFSNRITINDGDSGNTVNGSGLTGSHAILVHAGSGTDVLKGGDASDVFFAGGQTKMTGGAGNNQFTFSDIGTNTVADFGASGGNELVFSSAGFALGLAGTSTPQGLPANLIGSLSNGTFSTTAQRFAYNQGTGKVLFDADGSGAGSTAHAIATLTGNPAVSASQLFFVT